MSEDSDTSSQDANPKKSLLQRASLMPYGNIKTYSRGFVYILDSASLDDDENASSQPRDRDHAEFCEVTRNLFRTQTNYEVFRVRFNSVDMTEERFLSWWHNELAKTASDELVIVYFHGKTQGDGEDCTWRFQSKPRRLNVMQFIKTTNRSRSDVLFLIDCLLPTRHFKPPRRTRRHTEYCIAGQYVSNNINADETGFTRRVATFLQDFVESINEKFGGHRKRRTLPELLSKDRELASNPLRIWNSKTSRDQKYPVYRFVVDPMHVREHGTLQLFRVRLQPHGSQTGNGEDEDSNSEGDNDDDDGTSHQDEDDGGEESDADSEHSKSSSGGIAPNKGHLHDEDDAVDCLVCSGAVDDEDPEPASSPLFVSQAPQLISRPGESYDLTNESDGEYEFSLEDDVPMQFGPFKQEPHDGFGFGY